VPIAPGPCSPAMPNQPSARSLPPESHRKIAELLGKMLEEEEKLEARIFCRGGYDAARRYQYEGINTCAAANQLGGE